MFNRIIRDIKLILNNEGGWAVMAAMAVGSLLSSNSSRNASMKAQAADVKLQRAKLQSARVRAKDSLTTNTGRMRQAAQKREAQIETNRLQAESKIDETFAGSGLSGTSINELDRELDASVVRNKYENMSALDQQLSYAHSTYSANVEDIASRSSEINTTAPRNDTFGNLLGAVSAAGSVSGLDAKLSGSKFGKSMGL